MALWQRMGNFVKTGLSIKARLGMGIALLFVLILTNAVTVLVGRSLLEHAEEVMADSQTIERLVLEMNYGMQRARRLHSDFFLHAPEIGFVAAHEQYAQPSVRQIAQVITLSKALQELVEQSVVGEGLQANHVDVNLYLSFAKRFADTSIESVEVFTGLHAPIRGLAPQLDGVLKEISGELDRDRESFRLFMDMKSHVQEYRLSRQRPEMQSAFNVERTLIQSLHNDPLLGESRLQKILSLLDQGRSLAVKILVAETSLKSQLNDFALQAVAVRGVSTALAEMAKKEVEYSQQKIRSIRQLVVYIILVMTLTGFVAAFFVARMFNHSVIRRVDRLTRCAGELREGNLEVLIPEDSGDELGQLARTFNLMSARIRGLVNNLELKVAQRTAELLASESRYRQLFENSSSGVIIYEACDQGNDFIIRDCNRAVETIEQISRQEVIGHKVSTVFPGIREFGLLSLMQSVWETGQPIIKVVGYYADERVRGWRENAVYKLASGEIVCIYNDRTADKQAEAEKLAMEVKFQRARKMEALGLLAGGVAHDLNNILSGIVGFPDILLMHLPQDSELRKPVGIIKDSGLRAAAVVADLLTVARGATGRREIAGLNSLVLEYLASPEHLPFVARHPQVECVTRLDSNLPPIFCSPVHIKKCIMNLVSNAMESIDGAGQVVLSTGKELVTDHVALENNVNPGEYAVLHVSDTGKGIQEKDLEHIFEPFYSKKIMGISGTGLGLAVVWNSVIDHGGMIQVKSSPAGTDFSLYFPLAERGSVEAGKSAETGDFRSRGERILIVDDEIMLRDLAAAMLSSLGYGVEVAVSGEEAVAYCQTHTVDLVLLDMMMEPGINGLETYRQLLALSPTQKAIVISGYAETDDVKAVQALGAKRFLKKPYSIGQLGRAVRYELDGNMTGI